MTVNYQAKVVGGKLNMRKRPSANAERICQIPDGETITISAVADAWGQTTYGGQTGWVLLQYTEKTETEDGMISVPRKELEKIYDQLGDWLGMRG